VTSPAWTYIKHVIIPLCIIGLLIVASVSCVENNIKIIAAPTDMEAATIQKEETGGAIVNEIEIKAQKND